LSRIAAATGLTGFVGKNLLPLLLKEYDAVHNFTRGGGCLIYFADGSVKKFDKYYKIEEQGGPSVLYNLATYYNPNPNYIDDIWKITESNIIFPLTVLDNLNSGDLQIINFCSYLQLIKGSISSPYMQSKEYFKISLDSISKNVSNIFLFDTFGFNDDRNKVVDVFIKKILEGEDIVIPSNEITINLSDVSEVCRSLSPLENIPSGDCCIHSPFTISLKELAITLMRLMGKKSSIVLGKKSNCYYSCVQELPINIYKAVKENQFEENLLRRINEIRIASTL
jgi:nucleoside-diphosphate-sugar epimerase